MIEKQDFFKGKSLDLAAMEQLEINGVLDSSLLFKRAKQLYNEMINEDILTWNNNYSEKEIIINKEPEEKLQNDIEIDSNKKMCPQCQELIPIGWNAHNYKQDGTTCGYQYHKEE